MLGTAVANERGVLTKFLTDIQLMSDTVLSVTLTADSLGWQGDVALTAA